MNYFESINKIFDFNNYEISQREKEDLLEAGGVMGALKSGSKINKTYKILTSTANNNYIFYRMRLNSNEALGKF